MWLWQHKNIHKRHLLWAKLFSLCLFFHILFLFWIFCIYRDTSTITISLNTKIDYSAPILFIPAGVEKTPTQNKQPLTQKQPTAPQKKITHPVQKKPAPATSIIAPAKNKPTETKPEIKKIEEKPKIEKPVQKPEEKKEPIKSTQPKPTKSSTQPQPIIPENAIVSHDYREVEDLRRAAQLQKELIKNWRAPIGVPKDCACEIAITVTPTGSVKNLKMINSSGVVMYDISVRQAIFSTTMPQWTHGKTFTLNFKQ